MYVVNTKRRRKERVIIEKFIPSEIQNSKEFEFDWNEEVDNELFKLVIKKTGQILGLLSMKYHYEELRLEIVLLELSKSNIGKSKKFENVAGILIAFACKTSFRMKFFGFVSLVPKTRLISHYQNKYGFEQYGRQLALSMEDSQKLIEKYIEDEY